MNAHGVGFLAAAQDVARQMSDARPTGLAEDGRLLPGLEFITCTSGMIYWTYRYLLGADLRAELTESIREADDAIPLPNTSLYKPWRGPMLVSLVGLPGVFDSVATTYVRHLWDSWASFLTPAGAPYLATSTTRDRLWNYLLPAKVLTPRRSEQHFVEVAEVLDKGADRMDIGVAFNSFNLRTGDEYLHVNETALSRIRESYDANADFEARSQRRHYREGEGQTIYKHITPEYVKASLWLLEYGFDEKPGGERLIDGVYQRSIILDELWFADRIYVARPLNRRWIGSPPRNVFEREDLKTELWFGASYRAQRSGIDMINNLLASNPQGTLVAGNAPDGDLVYHPIELVEIEIELQQGFFDYFVESQDVFDDSYSRSRERLKRLETSKR